MIEKKPPIMTSAVSVNWRIVVNGIWRLQQHINLAALDCDDRHIRCRRGHIHSRDFKGRACG